MAESNQERPKGWMLWLVVLALVAALLVWAFRRDDGAASTEARAGETTSTPASKPDTPEAPAGEEGVAAAGAGGAPAEGADAGDPEAAELAEILGDPASELEADSAEDVERLVVQAQEHIEREEFSQAREAAVKCLALARDNKKCWQARVRSYTRAHDIPDVKLILRYCLAAQRDELNCLRALRAFHLDRGDSMQGSSVTAEIQQFYPESDLELPK